MISAAGVRLAGVHNWVAGLERFPSLLPCTLYELLRWQGVGFNKRFKVDPKAAVSGINRAYWDMTKDG